MTLAYNWSISTLKKIDTNDKQDVVVQAYWSKTGTDEQGLTGTFSGVTSFTLNSDPFIPFENLTEDIILGWIKSATANNESNINLEIQRQINDKKTIVTRMPWDLIPTPTE